MKFFDLLFMSVSNLWKRKLRTVLTVLGVIIGITSIVVMVALGNGLKESMIESYANYVSMTQIQVNAGNSYYESGSSSSKEEEKRLDDAFINQLLMMEHVEAVYPRLEFSAIAKTGKYVGWLNLYGVTQEELSSMNIDVGEGSLPEPDDGLKFFYGNNALINFFVEKTGAGYWDTGEAPDIDLMNDPIFVIFDTDAYWASRSGNSGEGQQPVKQPKKYVIETAGIMAGEIGDWKNNSQSIFCDIDALKQQLKRVYKKKPIPGQPTRKNGKPYNELFYSQLVVQVDDMANVTPLTNEIKDMGYGAYSDAEWIQSQTDTMNTVQAVLGAIGAVAMLVAAISITNTMMMSIYERTKEIGVMKVLGCDMHNIQALFLLEAGFIGFLGGIIGVGFSYGLGAVINSLMTSSGMAESMGISGGICRIPLWLSPLAVAFAIVVGMAAGFIPSLRAMRLSPLAAIRNE